MKTLACMRSLILGRIFLLVIIPILLCGCDGIVSEVQKKEMLAAGPAVTVDGTELQLKSSLHRTFYPDNRRFDLVGHLDIVSTNGPLPKEINVYHMALKPGWKGWPGYYVLNFVQKNGTWRAIPLINDEYLTFAGTSKTELDRIEIDFTWDNLGGTLGAKPKHFATYDVSVRLSDAQKKHYILTNPGVPTD